MPKVPITKEVTHADLDLAKALNLRQIRAQYPQFRGRFGGLINVDTLRRWANRKRGFHPVGKEGPVLILPMLFVGTELLSMPEWVEWFLSESTRIRELHRQKLTLPRTSKQKEKDNQRALAELRKEGFQV
jgi:hypothetical protein